MTSISDEKSIERIEHKSKKNLVLGTIFGYLAVLISVAYGIFMTPEIIRSPVIGEHQYGLYGLATSVINFFIFDFGLTTATKSYLARLRANGDKAGVERFIVGIFKINLVLDVIFIVIIAALYFSAPYVFANSYGNPVTYERTESIKTLQWLFIIVGCFSIINLPCYVFDGTISTYEKFSFLKLADVIQKTLYFIFTILCVTFHWTISGSGIIPIVVINVCSALFSILLKILYTRFYLNIHFDIRRGITKDERKEVLSFSAWSFALGICGRLVITITPFILGIVSTPDAVTLFTLISTMELYIFTFGTVISSFFMAKIARSTHDGTEEEKAKHLQELGEKVGKIQFVIIAMIMLGFTSVGYEFVLFWMKGDYKFIILYWCILAVCGYEIIHIPQLVYREALLTRGIVKPVAIAAIIKAVVNLGLSFGLSYYFTHSKYFSDLWYGSGAVGASIAIAAARIVEQVLLGFIYKKYLKVSTSHFLKTIYIRGLITMVISLGVGLGLHYLNILNFNNTLKFLVNGVIFVIVYTICTLFITFKKEERKYYVAAMLKLMHIKSRAKKEKPAEIEEKAAEEKATSEEIENNEKE